MECVRHGLLESGPSIFKAKRHFPISEGAPRANEGGLMLIFTLDMDLIISRESIHKGEYFISSAIVQDLINEKLVQTLILPSFLFTATGL